MADTVLTTAQAADMLGVSVSALKAWRQQRRGPRWVQLGRRIGYRRSTLLNWMEQQEAATVPDTTGGKSMNTEVGQAIPVLRDRLRDALDRAKDTADAVYQREYAQALRWHLDRGVDEETAQELARESAEEHRSEALEERTRQALLDLIADSKEMDR